MFLRFIGQVMGVTGRGAVLIFNIPRIDPGPGWAMDQILDHATRASFSSEQVETFTPTVILGLYTAWPLAGLFAPLASTHAGLLHARFSPITHT